MFVNTIFWGYFRVCPRFPVPGFRRPRPRFPSAPVSVRFPSPVSGVVNLVGRAPPREQILALPGAHLHLYDKAPRPGRKIGHVTLVAEDAATLDLVLPALLRVVESA